MASIDLTTALNAVSEVIINRPAPLREFDQIYMKIADMLLQCEHISRWLNEKNVIFIGDGDAIGLSLMYLCKLRILQNGPQSIHVIDFDERIVNSVKEFASKFDLKVTAELYNVAEALPSNLWQKHDAFYTNPPFGASNEGASIEAFLQRGIEATGANAVGCIAVADNVELNWTARVLRNTQKFLLNKNFIIVEAIPSLHHYHLDESPDLTSCSLVVRKIAHNDEEPSSARLPQSKLANFYGKGKDSKVRYVRDKQDDHHNGYELEYF